MFGEDKLWTLRPFQQYFNEFIYGYSTAFYGVDIAQPLYCLTDGLENTIGYFELLYMYYFKSPVISTDMNVADYESNYNLRCNPQYNGLVHLILLANIDAITKLVNDQAKWYSATIFYVVYSTAFVNSILQIQNVWTDSFQYHWDMFSLGFMIGKLSDALVVFFQLYYVFDKSTTQPQPTNF
ncbi:UNKNOWN [Stylonychia lemnae]|uniref:Uncharacterized protein n=1 Tax=Stylonychia lemnae TaxID=5949 RepID=A0A078AZY4_STYLE|nr:UNKNOWN [Stylonychia lemnae]|eukprot:CDW86742.1 UNKNOWN [Stylonychia lemnae]